MSKILLLALFLTNFGCVSIAQETKIKANGMLVFFDDRMAFFKSASLNLNSFLTSQKDTGVEVTNNYMIDRLLKLSDTLSVIKRYLNNAGLIITDTVLIRVVPVKFSYTKKKSKTKSSICTMGFEKDHLEYILNYYCITHGIAIENIEPNKKTIKRN